MCEVPGSKWKLFFGFVSASLALIVASSKSLTNATTRVASTSSILCLTIAIFVGLYDAGTDTTPLFKNVTPLPEFSQLKFSELSTAVMSALWSVDGWNTLNYGGEEIVNPNKNLPRIVQFVVPLITVVFTFVNFSYLVVLDDKLVASSQTIGVDLAVTVFGSYGALFMPLFVACSSFGASVGILFGSFICMVGNAGLRYKD
jgi:amino acid transporter